MYIARLHKGGLVEAMETAREFETELEMKQWFVEQHEDAFDLDDVVVDIGSTTDDPRIGWHNTMYVCVKRYGNENFMEKYGVPQCIGMCATDYERK